MVIYAYVFVVPSALHHSHIQYSSSVKENPTPTNRNCGEYGGKMNNGDPLECTSSSSPLSMSIFAL